MSRAGRRRGLGPGLAAQIPSHAGDALRWATATPTVTVFEVPRRRVRGKLAIGANGRPPGPGKPEPGQPEGKPVTELPRKIRLGTACQRSYVIRPEFE